MVRSRSELLFDSFNILIMILFVLILFYPFIYILSYSLSIPGKISGGLLIFPKGFTLDSYIEIFDQRRLINAIGVSVARTIIGPAVMIFFSSMAAYVLTRNDFIGIKKLRKFFVFTLYFNSGLIPLYLLAKNLGLVGSFWIYVIPAAVSVFNMILIKTYIESLPENLQEAAIIDGANDLVLFWRVIFPICMPVSAAVILFTAVEQWNSFLDTQIYNVMHPEYHTLQYVLYQVVAGAAASLEEAKQVGSGGSTTAGKQVSQQSIRMAITIITLLPIACLYPLLQKHFAKGLLIGAIKG